MESTTGVTRLMTSPTTEFTPGPLHGYLVCSTGLNLSQRQELAHIVISLGGRYTGDYTEDVNILVAERTGSEKYKLAVRVCKPIVLPGWAYAYQHAVLDGVTLDSGNVLEQFLLPPFAGCRVHLTGFPHALVRQKIQNLIMEYGGRYDERMSVRCTHLIAPAPQGNKYNLAQTCGIHIVNLDWVLDSVNMKACADEHLYPVLAPQDISGGESSIAKLGAFCLPDHLSPNQSGDGGNRRRRRLRSAASWAATNTLQRSATAPVYNLRSSQKRERIPLLKRSISDQVEELPSVSATGGDYIDDGRPPEEEYSNYVEDPIVEEDGRDEPDLEAPLALPPPDQLPSSPWYFKNCYFYFGDGFGPVQCKHLQKIVTENGGRMLTRLPAPKLTHFVVFGCNLTDGDQHQLNHNVTNSSVKIVEHRWLRECYHQQSRVSEIPYLLEYTVGSGAMATKDEKCLGVGDAASATGTELPVDHNDSSPGSLLSHRHSLKQLEALRATMNTPTPVNRSSLTRLPSKSKSDRVPYPQPSAALATLESFPSPISTVSTFRQSTTSLADFSSTFPVPVSRVSWGVTKSNVPTGITRPPPPVRGSAPVDITQCQDQNQNQGQGLHSTRSDLFKDLIFTGLGFSPEHTQVLHRVVEKQGGRFFPSLIAESELTSHKATSHISNALVTRWQRIFLTLDCIEHPRRVYVVAPLTSVSDQPLTTQTGGQNLAIRPGLVALASTRNHLRSRGVQLHIVNECWLERCLERLCLFNEDDLPLFKPLLNVLPIPQCRGLVIGVSGFEGLPREHLIKFIRALGAECTEKFSRRNTHLVCKAPQGPKYDKAMQWGIPVMDEKWVMDLVFCGGLPMDLNLTSQTTSSSALSHTLNNMPGPCTPAPRNTQTFIHLNFCDTYSPAPPTTEGQSISTPKANAQPPESIANDSHCRLTLTVPTGPEVHPSPRRMSSPEQPSASQDRTISLHYDTPTSDEESPLSCPISTSKQVTLAMTHSSPPRTDTPLQSSTDTTKFDLDSALSALKTPSHPPLTPSLERNVPPVTPTGATPVVAAFRCRMGETIAWCDTPQALVDTLPEEPIRMPVVTPTGAYTTPNKGFATMVSDSVQTPVSPDCILRGLVLCLSQRVSHRRAELTEISQTLGAHVTWVMSDMCTHFVHQGTKVNETFRDFKLAKQLHKPIVSPWWLHKCYEERRRLPENAYPHTFNPCLLLDLRSTLTSPQVSEDMIPAVAIPTPKSTGAHGPPMKMAKDITSKILPKPTESSVDGAPVSEKAQTVTDQVDTMSDKVPIDLFSAKASSNADAGNDRAQTDNTVPLKDYSATIEALLGKIATPKESKPLPKRWYRRNPAAIGHSPVDPMTQAMSPPTKVTSQTKVQGDPGHLSPLESDTPRDYLMTQEPLAVHYQDPEAQKEKARLLFHLRDQQGVSDVGSESAMERLDNDPCDNSSPSAVPEPKPVNNQSTAGLGPSITHVVDTGAPAADFKTMPPPMMDCQPRDARPSNTLKELPRVASDLSLFEGTVPLSDASALLDKQTSASRQDSSTLHHLKSSNTVATTNETKPITVDAPRPTIQPRWSPPPSVSPLRSSPSATSISPSKKIFQFSGIPPTKRKRFVGIIKRLGGQIGEADGFDPYCTHIIVGYPNRSEKVMAAIAHGLWLLQPTYLDQSSRSGQFVNELDYEWAQNQDIPPDEAILALAARRWREHLAASQSNSNKEHYCGGGGAFAKWQVLLCTSELKQQSYQRLLEAGGAQVEQLKLGAQREMVSQCRQQDFTHVIVDAEVSPRIRRELWEIMAVEKKCLCMTTEFIVQYLIVNHGDYGVWDGLLPCPNIANSLPSGMREAIQQTLADHPVVKDAWDDCLKRQPTSNTTPVWPTTKSAGGSSSVRSRSTRLSTRKRKNSHAYSNRVGVDTPTQDDFQTMSPRSVSTRTMGQTENSKRHRRS
ncbi:protein kinase activating protein dpb11 [Dispira simplex]|nr:protein kinase activating protein dpb11 [Dispira simplex]